MHGVIEAAEDLEAALANVPNGPGVYALWPREGTPHLAQTGRLRSRLLRLLRRRGALDLRAAVARVEYWLAGSSFESGIRLYELARRHFPENYLERLRLRPPPYVKVILQNTFPRCQVTTRLGRAPALYYGPFQSRAGAERFQAEFLDLFQMRRCQEDLEPSPHHPGCIYGEMGACLRPCQGAVGVEEYRHEVGRVTEFLASGGRSLLDSVGRARDRLSEEMQFEDAARQHKRLERIQAALALRDELAFDLEHLHGVAVTRSLDPSAVMLWPFARGVRQPELSVAFALEEGRPVSLDRRLREALGAVRPSAATPRERQDGLALLSRWFYSTWRDGEFLRWERFEDAPYRRLVAAVARVAARK